MLTEVVDAFAEFDDIAFSQAVDVARCRGWITIEGKASARRACLTKAGCMLASGPTWVPFAS
jgi:hypothetical protein